MKLGIKDENFIRGRVPMTKEEIRILSVVKLQLDEDSIVFDIGAGTGAVSIEMAVQCKNGIVYAIEKNPEAIALIRANREKFKQPNLKIKEGIAPECLAELPSPTHVFVGGSGGRLLDIIRAVREKNSRARLVLNAVTLETMAQLREIQEQFPEYSDMEIIQAGIARSKALGDYHLMCAENPVYIVSFGG